MVCISYTAPTFRFVLLSGIQPKKQSHNIYAKTREECEEKLAEMIAEVKAQIKAEKDKMTG